MSLARQQKLHALPDDIQLSLCRLDDDQDIPLAQALASLSDQEHSRAMRFRFKQDQMRFMRGRGFMRRALGHQLGMRAADVPLIEGAYNKPALRCQGPGFNLSHSGPLAVLVIRDTGSVGVDLEVADRAVDPQSVARGCFQAHERAALRAVPKAAQSACFLTFWTAKEALMKLTGAGLFLDPKSIGLRLQDGLPFAVPCGFDAPSNHRAVSLFFPDLGPDHVVAVAWEQS